jgi:hypothetical protein
MRSSIITGARVVCYINSIAVGKVTGFHWESDTSRKAIYGLDSGEPYELAPTTTRIGGEIGLLRTEGDGGLEGLGVVAQFPNLPREEYFSITLLDRASDTVLFRADKCAVKSQKWGVSAKQVMSGSFSFEGLLWTNETRFR